MPSSGNLIFPFMAANLSAVDLTVIKIFENNLPYFLQQNSMGEANAYGNIRPFGRPVYRGRVDLTGGAGFDPNRYNLFTIDLANYIEPEQGILYRIELGMRPSYSLYPCTGTRTKSKYEELLEQSDLDRHGKTLRITTLCPRKACFTGMPMTGVRMKIPAATLFTILTRSLSVTYLLLTLVSWQRAERITTFMFF